MSALLARSKNAAKRLAVRCGIARLARDEKGATAVEFAIVAFPFMALMFAILETALAFFAGQALETAVANAARLVRTGQAQQQDLSETAFRQKICDQLGGFFTCSAIYVDVKKYANFSDIILAKPIDEDGNFENTGFTYEPGVGGEIVTVRAYYEWPLMVTKLGYKIGNLSNGNALLAAAAAFRNEPFPW